MNVTKTSLLVSAGVLALTMLAARAEEPVTKADTPESLRTEIEALATSLLICPPKSHFGGAVVWRIWMEWVGAPRRVVVEAQ